MKFDEEFDEESPGFADFLKEFCKTIGENVRTEAFSHNLPIVFMRDNLIIKQYPDGFEEVISKVNF